ncbi:MAG TPA: hypothetical protein VG095_04425 [Chthoniobacterales bacterium]|nr:hypothetical protein [Chthoniobacterales bacterium]
MRPFTLVTLLCGCSFAASTFAANIQQFEPTYALKRTKAEPEEENLSVAAVHAAKKKFTYKDRKGAVVSAEIIDRYQEKRIVYPLAKIDSRINPKLVRAASIAQERARARSKSRCWHYVKNALLASGVISSYPKTVYAKQAAQELVQSYGFKKLPIRDPYKAPVGAVLVYGGRGAGHVEIRNRTGFVSDFRQTKPSKRKLIGVYAKA